MDCSDHLSTGACHGRDDFKALEYVQCRSESIGQRISNLKASFMWVFYMDNEEFESSFFLGRERGEG